MNALHVCHSAADKIIAERDRLREECGRLRSRLEGSNEVPGGVLVHFEIEDDDRGRILRSYVNEERADGVFLDGPHGFFEEAGAWARRTALRAVAKKLGLRISIRGESR